MKHDEQVLHAFEHARIENFFPAHSTTYEDAQLKRALSALCGLQDDLNSRRRAEIFTDTLLSRKEAKDGHEEVLGLHKVSSRDKISQINQKIGYTRALIGLLKNFYEDALFPTEQDLEGIFDELGLGEDEGSSSFHN